MIRIGTALLLTLVLQHCGAVHHPTEPVATCHTIIVEPGGKQVRVCP